MLWAARMWKTLFCLVPAYMGIVCLAPNALAAKRAFVVGITTYDQIDPSVNSTNDAALIRDTLQRYGYSMTFLEQKDANVAGFTSAWSRFLSAVSEEDDVLFYFSGHGFSYQGNNFLALRDVPKDASHDDAVNYSKDISKLADSLTNRFVHIGLFIIEACRNDPFGYKDHAIQQGTTIVNRLERSTDSSAIVVWYAASEGETSLAETAPGKETISLFTNILAENLDRFRFTDIERFAKELRTPVLHASPVDHQQHPWLASNLTYDWCFGGECPPTDDRPQVTAYSKPGSSLTSAVVHQVSLDASNYSAYLSQRKLDGNAMFIGKKSRLQNCQSAENDDSPFGCEILAALSEGEGKTERVDNYLNRPLKLETATNLRLALPTQISAANDHALYACSVRTYPRGKQVAFSNIVALHYNKDTYYWGIVAGQNFGQCAGQATDRSRGR
jgi:hypothetical protein